MLLKSGADANLAMADGRTPIHIAAEAGNIGVIKLLLENEANILATYQVSPLSPQAADTGSNVMLWQDGETALHKACKMCNYNVLKCLMDFAKESQPDSFKSYVNSVNVKVSETGAVWGTTVLNCCCRGSPPCTTSPSCPPAGRKEG